MPFLMKTELKMATSPTGSTPQCGACGLYKGCHTPKMKVSGRGRKGILVVAEAPGEVEDHRGEPLVGPSGKRLDAAFLKAGIEMRTDCWLTNSVICRPPGNRLPEGVPVVDHCRPNLINTVKKLKPKMILVLGGTAVQSVIGWTWPERSPTHTISRWAGYRIPDRTLNCWVCPTYHPAHVLRAEGSREPVVGMMFDRHVRRAATKVRRPYDETPPPLEEKVEVIQDSAEAADAVRETLGNRPVTFAFDYETNMGNPDHQNSKIVCVSVSTGFRGRTLAFPWLPATKEALGRYLTDPRWPKIGANCKFEDRWTRRHLGKPVAWGPGPMAMWDCMLAAHVLDNGNGKIRPVTGVKFQAYVRLGVGNYSDKVEPYLKPKEETYGSVNLISKIDAETLLTYCGIDSLVEYELAKVQCREAGIPFPEPS